MPRCSHKRGFHAQRIGFTYSENEGGRPYVGGCVGGCPINAEMLPNEVMFVQHRVPTALPTDPKNWADHGFSESITVPYKSPRASVVHRLAPFPTFFSSEPSQWPSCPQKKPSNLHRLLALQVLPHRAPLLPPRKRLLARLGRMTRLMSYQRIDWESCVAITAHFDSKGSSDIHFRCLQA